MFFIKFEDKIENVRGNAESDKPVKHFKIQLISIYNKFKRHNNKFKKRLLKMSLNLKS